MESKEVDSASCGGPAGGVLLPRPVLGLFAVQHAWDGVTSRAGCERGGPCTIVPTCQGPKSSSRSRSRTSSALARPKPALLRCTAASAGSAARVLPSGEYGEDIVSSTSPRPPYSSPRSRTTEHPDDITHSDHVRSSPPCSPRSRAGHLSH
ncbi:hypothetical protein CC85DRAFT_95701 [Cutaneotrichosporon oleaginosum]|uniref:Uncharacterized protein n=1 Tax=Cutaneotrichosporon oleaginosum TaxID=879819 RepID=A0A0J0XMJ4_9TREE|nr:uncharacterized protein CC85DRAFT_95701 [Cutaneotrichosporon oleaginosum]KLT42293.1 hypothetical protein CC85DRAFT_95701 [Cutaneotrichosporon oleaginosum]TXT11465.1 hypothetical protein COLE_01875 [Cutaneotrichosporon oleaginosum]